MGNFQLQITRNWTGNPMTINASANVPWIDIPGAAAFANESAPSLTLAGTYESNTGAARNGSITISDPTGQAANVVVPVSQSAGSGPTPTTYWNVAKSGMATRNNCPSNQSGSSVTYTVLAHTYSSTVSQTAADALAQADVDANKQAYANQNGTCSLNYAAPDLSNLTMNGWQGHSPGDVVDVDILWDVANEENIAASFGLGYKYEVTLTPPGATNPEDSSVVVTDDPESVTITSIHLVAGQYLVGVRAVGVQGEELLLAGAFDVPESEPTNTYPLTYDLNGGSIANYDGGTPPCSYEGGTSITMPATVPTKNGFVFAGWLESTIVGELLMPGESSNSGMIDSGLNYVAQWTAAPATYPLVYDLDGGTMANYNGGTTPGNYPAGYQIVAPTTVPVKDGFDFTGWHSSVTDQILNPGDVDNAGMMDGGVTFTAQWTSNSSVPSTSVEYGVVFQNNITTELPFEKLEFTITEQYTDDTSQTSNEGNIQASEGTGYTSVSRPDGKTVASVSITGHADYDFTGNGYVTLTVESGGSGSIMLGANDDNHFTFAVSSNTITISAVYDVEESSDPSDSGSNEETIEG